MLRGLLNSAIRSQMASRGGASTGRTSRGLGGGMGGTGTGRRSRGYGGGAGGGDIGGQIGAQVGRTLFNNLMRRR